MEEPTEEQIVDNRKEYKDITDFVNETYDGCVKREISLSVNVKTGRIHWSKLHKGKSDSKEDEE